MNMITRKKLIAALLIPIMLIAFSVPSFATSTTSGFDLQAFTDKALELLMDVGGVSIDLVGKFATDFMGIDGLEDVVELVPELVETGLDSIGGLIDIFQDKNFTSATDILGMIPELLDWGIGTGLAFYNDIFQGFMLDLQDPTTFLKLAGGIIDFGLYAGEKLAGVILGDVDLGDIGNSISNLLAGGSVGDLSGIFNTLLQSDSAQIPSLDLNFDKTSLIQLLGSVTSSMSGPIGDILDSGMDIVDGILDSFTNSDSSTSQLPSLDYGDIVTGDNGDETPTTDKPDITTPSTVTNSSDYQYTDTTGTYKLAVTQSKFVNAKNEIANKAIYSNNEAAKNLDSKDIASYYVYIMTKELNSVSLDGVKLENYDSGKGIYGDTDHLTDHLRVAIDDKKPAIVRIDEFYWVTCVGYKNDGKKFSDFLFLDTNDGQQKPGGSNAIPDFYSKIRTNAIYTF